jgi:hypothetical protein
MVVFSKPRSDHGDDTGRRRSRGRKLVAALVGALLAGTAAFAVTNWVVGLNAGSSGQAQSATISNLSITAVAAPAATNLLYPGATGDVVVKIANPNPFPVTVTAVQLPANTSFATGYSDSALTTPVGGCTAASSTVAWNFATGTSGTSHTLTSALTVAANGNLTVTLTNDAVMGTTAPLACAGTYFSMPSLTGVTAYADTAAATAGPATDAWTA